MGTSNCTQQILKGTIGARFDNINLDGDTVNSSLTEPTQTTPPQQPRKLNANSNEHNYREQEEQKEEEDEMEVENYGTKKDNKEDNLPDPDEVMANEDSSNEHKGENRRNNGKNDDIDDHSEGSTKESEDKEVEEGGGRRRMASGRGRGSYHLGIQDDKGGRGGNHSQETKGSNIDTSHKNTNTIVVHQKDNTAQSRGKNEQEPKANGKSDNVSTSPRQTGAQEDAAG